MGPIDLLVAGVALLFKALAKLLQIAVPAALVGGRWAMSKTWRRLFPLWWAVATVTIAAGAGATGLRGLGGVALTAFGCVVAAAAPARSGAVRMYRLAITGLLGLWMVTVLSVGTGRLVEESWIRPALWASLALLAVVLGWPWWYELRGWEPAAEEEPEIPAEQQVDEALALWQDKWERFAEDKVCPGSKVVAVEMARPHVVELDLRLPRGATAAQIERQGAVVDSCLDIDTGSTGFIRSRRARNVRLSIVGKSYIEQAVAYNGPQWNSEDGTCQAMMYADGSWAHWHMLRPRFGALNGLVVGSTGSGKSMFLGLTIDAALHAGIPVVIGDCQNGQSLPAWRDTVGEFHAGVDQVIDMLNRACDEVFLRSELLADAGVAAYDMTDPRVIALGIKPMRIVCDEIHLVLTGEMHLKWLVAKLEAALACSRKTGVGFEFATQIPQLMSLAHSQKLRDALVAGNTAAFRLSNKVSKNSILDNGFVGDPFSIPATIELGGREVTTAGTGYMRDQKRIGMVARAPWLKEDGAIAAAKAPRIDVCWLAPQPERPQPAGFVAPQPIRERISMPDRGVRQPLASAPPVLAESMSSAPVGVLSFGKSAKVTAVSTIAAPPRAETCGQNPRAWVIATLRAAPQSAQALLSRPDCQIGQSRLYELLKDMKNDGIVVPPTQQGGNWTIAQ